MLRDAALLGLCLVAACAADPPSASEAPPQRIADHSPTTRSSDERPGLPATSAAAKAPVHQPRAGLPEVDAASSTRPLVSPLPRPSSPLPRPSDALIEALARCPTADEMRAQLEAGLTKQELQFRGFDGVTIAECIDNLIAASLDSRRQPAGPRVRARLTEWAELFVAGTREASVRRSAGAASCLPSVR